jgi:DNA repair protein RecO (recombination protein O)
MHKVFVTEGIVLSKRSAGEENTLVSILTPDLGLVRASARSARREAGKLRYGLEPLTVATFSLIRGKYEWKLTGTQNISRALVSKSLPARQAAGRVLRLMLRLIRGEEAQQDLYTTVREGLSALARGVDVEAVLVLRVLSHLGYLPDTKELRPFIEQDFFSLELMNEVTASRRLIIKTINESLESTGL